MNEKEFTTYDKVISTTLVNFMIEDNRNDGLLMGEFNPKNMNHLYAFEVIMILSTSIQKIVYLDMPLISYWKFKLNNWKIRKSFKRYGRNNEIKKIETNKILDFMKKELNLEDDIYEKIYKAYYEKGIENRSIYRWKRKG